MPTRKATLTLASALLALPLALGDAGPFAVAGATAEEAFRTQRGQASYYAPKFNGRKMANGRRFNPESNSAAHKTLPLGTTARVTNLDNGRSAIVRVEDRGPFVRGRIIDVSPRVARQLGMKKEGVVRVAVTPLSLPESEGRSRQAQR